MRDRASLSLVAEQESDAAIERLHGESFDAVIVDGSDAATVTKVLGAALEHETCRRFALADYDELPELVRCVETGLIERVFARPLEPRRLARTLAVGQSCEALRPVDPEGRGSEQPLSILIARLVELPGAVIRPLARHDPAPRLQIVIPESQGLRDLRLRLPSLLGWPLKASGSAMGRCYKSHPLRQHLGALSEEQEVYVVQGDPQGDPEFYVALFPWQSESKVTVVLGSPGEGREAVEALHDLAVTSAPEYPLPEPHRHSPEMFYDPVYDWVITKNYVGPDRRRKRTSFINRYTFRGRRQALMPNELASVDTFVDVAPSWVWWTAAGFALLFLFDTAMTAYYVGGGQVAELNPLMRWALGHSPVLFWSLKSLLAGAVAFVVMRWHLWRPGRWMFGTAMATYAVLDVYWVVLYVMRIVK